MKRYFALALAIISFLSSARAEGPDDQYVRIYNTIQEADAINTSGRQAQALTKYLEAQTALERFHKINADWNPKVVNFRLNYISEKIAAITAATRKSVPQVPVASNSPAPAGASQVSPASNNSFDAEVNSLRDQIRQMQVDKIVLEAKLKESLAAQPAVTDPRELAKAQDQVKSLQKENALLRVNANQPGPAATDTKALEAARQALAESSRKLAEQTDRANALAVEKNVLQQKLESLAPASSNNAAALDAARKGLEQANRQIAEEKEASARAAAERDQLQARIATLSAAAETADALRAENQIIKKQLAELRAAPPADNSGRLAEAQARIAALQSDKDILRLEKIALENRLKQVAAHPTVSRPEDIARIKQLERDREELQKQLENASKELAARGNSKDKAAVARALEMENQIATLRARLEVFEARAVPYTAEELALFKRPEIEISSREKDPNAGKKSVKTLPPGSAPLVADAQRYFSERQFDKAEEK